MKEKPTSIINLNIGTKINGRNLGLSIMGFILVIHWMWTNNSDSWGWGVWTIILFAISILLMRYSFE